MLIDWTGSNYYYFAISLSSFLISLLVEQIKLLCTITSSSFPSPCNRKSEYYMTIPPGRWQFSSLILPFFFFFDNSNLNEIWVYKVATFYNNIWILWIWCSVGYTKEEIINFLYKVGWEKTDLGRMTFC